ncbi:hypothetical protein J1N35_018678 [Gossypium stocksii]|uniref:Uncharacterized protein n=1 Tax=Gossypium stocksii TaxID=47602 RepID=A0A9D4A7F9_9ROSI|nr:hypothetical protein J1N35_018678 [Gossypium stocksii]
MLGFSQSNVSSQSSRETKNEMGSRRRCYVGCLHKEASQFRHRSFPYYDQLTAIYAKDRATRKDAQTVIDIIEEIDVEDVATTNTYEENDFYRCEADLSLDDMDLSATQPQPPRNQENIRIEVFNRLTDLNYH